MGPLLELTDQRLIVDTVTKFVTDTKQARKRRRAEWERNRLWVKGIRGVKVRRISEDKDDVELQIPYGAYDIPPIMDRTNELLEKRVSHLTSDPAVPDAEPASESPEDRDDAEFTTRLLTIEGSESGFNNQKLIRRAAKKASFCASAFLYACVDPMGGGWRPMECRATEEAKTLDTAGQITDPATKQLRDATDDELTTRYVMPDKTLTDDASKADRQWMPKLVPEILTGEHVVFIPETCSGIDDADGVVLIRPTTLGKLMSNFPDVAKMSDEQKRRIVAWRPEDSTKVAPRFTGKAPGAVPVNPDQTVSENASVITLVLYMKSGGRYPKGAYIVCAGEDLVLHKDFHMGMVEGEMPTDPVMEEMLELPFAQVRDIDDDTDDDPYGKATAERLGPADEFRGDIVLWWSEYLEKFGRPNTYLPIGSVIQPDELNRRDGTPILFNPQGQPVQETIPAFPPDAKEFFDRAGTSQDSASMLEATAQGVDSPNSQSGVAKDAVIQQAHVNLTMSRSNLADAQERWWRIVAQLFRVYWTIPAMLKYTGDDGAYKMKEWTRADLGSTKNIKVARGSFTQQSNDQKQQALDIRKSQNLISNEEYERLSASNLRAVIGFQDNPHRMRARRQLTAWREGPDEKTKQARQIFEQQQQAYQQIVQQIQSVQVPPPPMSVTPPAGGPPSAGGPPTASQAPAPVPAAPQLPPPPVDPIQFANPFADKLPIDDEMDVAQYRWAEFRAEIAGTGFKRKPGWWQKCLVDAYLDSKGKANVLTVAEQKQAAGPQAVQPGSPEENWQKVIQTVTNQAIQKAEQVAALMVESASGIGGKGIPGQSPEPTTAPEPAPTLTPDAEHGNDTKLQMHAMTLQHQKDESALKRKADLEARHADHAHALTSDTAKQAFEAEKANAAHAQALTEAALTGAGTNSN